MKCTTTATLAASALLVALGGAAAAQDFSYGQSLFKRNCAVCHGLDAAGDGPVADKFLQAPRNLRQLAADNNGIFPFSEVYQTIDGRRTIGAHGTTEMPIWGELFYAEALPKEFHPGVTAEDVVQTRILGLVYYLQSIQE